VYNSDGKKEERIISPEDARGLRGRDRMISGFTNTCAIRDYHQAVSSNPVHGEMYMIQQYVIKFVSELR
jgi:hypothetical protein